MRGHFETRFDDLSAVAQLDLAVSDLYNLQRHGNGCRGRMKGDPFAFPDELAVDNRQARMTKRDRADMDRVRADFDHNRLRR